MCSFRFLSFLFWVAGIGSLNCLAEPRFRVSVFACLSSSGALLVRPQIKFFEFFFVLFLIFESLGQIFVDRATKPKYVFYAFYMRLVSLD